MKNFYKYLSGGGGGGVGWGVANPIHWRRGQVFNEGVGSKLSQPTLKDLQQC